MEVKTYITLTLQDAHGRVRKRRRFESHSYVQQMAEILRTMLGQVTTSALNISNVAQNVTPVTTALDASGPVTSDLSGIVVGTGAGAVAIGNVALTTQIAHGAGAGQLNHQAQVYNAPTTIGSSRRFTTNRGFQNGSGASITVNETGIYVRNASLGHTFCIVRDLVSPGVAVPNTQTLTVTCTIQVTA